MALGTSEMWCLAPAVAFAAAAAVAGVASVEPSGRRPQERPAPLRAGVDLLTVDVQVSPAKDAPLRDFTGADFEVRVSARQRPIVSLTLLHLDEGPVARSPLGHGGPDCVFGFRRKTDRPTAHYVVAIERTAADRTEVKQVEVELLDTAFAVEWVVYRSPVRMEHSSATCRTSGAP